MRAWIDVLPEWQTAHARRIDAVVPCQASNVHKAIKRHRARYDMPGVDVPGIETKTSVTSWFDIEDPDGSEMRCCQVLTSDTQVTGVGQQP